MSLSHFDPKMPFEQGALTYFFLLRNSMSAKGTSDTTSGRLRRSGREERRVLWRARWEGSSLRGFERGEE